MDGGENRLNVAITRAKKKIYVVTSIEPEELNVDSSKNNGPKLFRSYLAYARAVSANKSEEANARRREQQEKERLEKERLDREAFERIKADLRGEDIDKMDFSEKKDDAEKKDEDEKSDQ